MVLSFFLTLLGSGILWRLRGGAFTTLTKVSFGTGFARAIAAVGIPAILSLDFGSFYPLALAPAIFVGLLLTGWGPFQAIGTSGGVPEKSWMRWLPLRLGFPAGSVAHDAIGLMESGVVLMILPACVVGLLTGTWWTIPAVTAFGLLLPGAYLLGNKLNLPTITNFATRGSWSEVFAGVVVSAGLFFGLNGFNL